MEKTSFIHKFVGDFRVATELYECCKIGKLFKVKDKYYYLETIKLTETDKNFFNIEILWRLFNEM